MTSDGDALFRALCEHPEDDTPRLVYADWLEENGQPERAEFIRLQCEKWNLCPAYPTVEQARRRAFELAREFGDAWYDALPAIPGVTWGGLFVRGFIDAVRVAADDAKTIDRLDAVFAAAPVTRLTVAPLDQKRLPAILASPLLGRLAKLNLPRSAPTHSGVFPYTAASHKLLANAVERLSHVEFNYPRPGERW